MKPSKALALGVLAIASTAVAAEIGTTGLVILQRFEGKPLRTATPVPGSPAARAGIKPGGLLIAVNGTNVVNTPFDQALTMLRGTPGTSVVLEIADSTLHHTNKFTLKRGKLVHSNNNVEVVVP